MGLLQSIRDANARAKAQGREVRARQEAQRSANEAAGFPTEGARRRSRHPKGKIVAFIWVGLFVVGFVGAAVFHDNNPNTDDAAGWGALIGAAGIVLTAAYVLGSVVANSLNRLRKREPPAPPER